MTKTSTLETKETTSLIASDKVEGTAVYGTDQKKIGKLERAMIDKISGKVAYAVLSFGGFMGMGEDYYPVPWATLTHQGPTRKGAEIQQQHGLELEPRERPSSARLL